MKNNTLILGSVQFGTNYGINNKKGQISINEVFDILNEAFDSGIDTIDTASLYGTSELVIGDFLKTYKKDFKLISKLPPCIPKEVEEKFKSSCARLGVDTLYGYLIHNFKTYYENPKIWEIISGLKDEGKIKKIGFSLYYPGELEYLINNDIKFDIVQVPFSIFDQRFGPYFKQLKNANKEIHVRSVFLQGLVFKKADELTVYFEKMRDKISGLNLIAVDNSISIASLCLNFVLLNEYVDKAVIGVDSKEHLKEIIKSLLQYKDVKKLFNKLEEFKETDEKIILPVNWEKECCKANKRIIAIIQARMGSTRLPNKTLIDISGKSLLEHIIYRVRISKNINDIIVATTQNSSDDVIIELCKNIGVKTFRGSEDDVLDRFYKCAKEFNADIIVRITADDPFKDPFIIDKAIEEILSDEKLDYVSNTIKPTYPEGIDVEVFTFHALQKAHKEAVKPSDKEHVTPYIWTNPLIFTMKNFENDADISHLRWTLDNHKDLEFTREIYKRLYKPDTIFTMNDILLLLEKEPCLTNINSGIERLAGYKKSISNETDMPISRHKEQ